MSNGENERDKADVSDFIDGSLSIFGLKIDLGQLLGSHENLVDRLATLRESLKEAGGREVLSDAEWRRGAASVSGRIRTRGVFGDEEFHIGTAGKAGRKGERRPEPEAPQVVEPPVDVFDEEHQVVIVADVPGVRLEDLELNVEGGSFSLTTRDSARRRYQKQLPIEANVDPASLQATCINGVLEVRLQKRATEA